MDSADLSRDGFDNWLAFSAAVEARVLAQVPGRPGVFAFRRDTPYSRQVGTSDLVYIGVGANRQRRQGLHERVRQVFRPGPTQTTNQRLLDLMKHSHEYQLGFTVTSDREEANALKKRLLERYRHEHGELPPENRAL